MSKVHLIRLIVVVLVAAGYFALAEQTEAQSPTGEISGTVRMDGNPAEGVTVNLWSGPSLWVDTTNAAGGYIFDSLSHGEYSVTLELGSGWWSDPATRSGKLKPGENLTWDFEINRTTEVMVFLHSLTGELSVDPDPLRIKPGQEIVWSTPRLIDSRGDTVGIHSISPEPDGAFSIQFEPISPLIYRKYKAEAGDAIETQVRTTILPGSYRYFIAVLLDGKIYTEDPELIDENGDEEHGGTIR